jgi:hypothetical protein
VNHSKTADPLFYPGEVAAWQLEVGDPTNGEDCVVLGSMEWHDNLCTLEDDILEFVPAGFYYPVRDSDGLTWAAPWELRKKPPPQAQESVNACQEVTV